MKQVVLGNSGSTVSAMRLGTMYFGSRFKGGESELTVGKWIKERKNKEDIFLATKCGVRPTGKHPDGSFLFEGFSKNAIETSP